MRQASQSLLTNCQGGPLDEMKISADQPFEYHILGSIVVHTMAVLGACSTNPVLLPFINMLTNPEALEVSKVHPK